MATKSDKTMDVAKPGKTVPDSSARPIVVTHKPMVEDPMVNTPDESPTTESAAEPKQELMSHNAKPVQPLGGEAPPDDNPNKSSADQPDSEKTEVKPAAKEDDSAETAVVEAVADQAEEQANKKDDKLAEQEKARQEHIQKLTEAKTYFVPVGQVARRRNQRTTILLFVVLLVVIVGGYLAIDGGVIKTNFKLPFHLIKN